MCIIPKIDPIAPAMMVRGLMFISTVVLYSLACDAINVMGDNNFTTALRVQIQISILLIKTVRKSSITPIVLTNQLGLTLKKAQKTIQATTHRGCQDDLDQMISIFVIFTWNIGCFQTMFASTVSRRNNKYAKVHVTDFGCTRVHTMASRSEVH